MFKHFLIATDGSPLSENAARSAVQLAQSLSARVTAVIVSEPFHVFTTDYGITNTIDAYNGECESRARRSLDVVRKAAESAAVAFEGIHVYHDQPYAAIIDVADKKACDVICMASHGRKGVAGLVLGSQTVKALTHSKIPVVVWR
jgi:nucleotide-binding universal stress UspA family protein